MVDNRNQIIKNQTMIISSLNKTINSLEESFETRIQKVDRDLNAKINEIVVGKIGFLQ